MAIAHDASAKSHPSFTISTSEASFSWTHTPSGTPAAILVFVGTNTSIVDHITSVTYGGVAMTRVVGGSATTAGTSEPGRVDLFILDEAIPTGAQTVVVNRTNDAVGLWATSVSVTAGAGKVVELVDLTVQESGLFTPVEIEIDDGSPGANSVRYAVAFSGLISGPTTGANSTAVQGVDIASTGVWVVRETTAGQGARLVGWTGAEDDWAAVYVAVTEASAAAAGGTDLPAMPDLPNMPSLGAPK